MQGPPGPLLRARSAALIAAVAALLTSVGATARAEAPASGTVHAVVSHQGVPMLEEIAAVLMR